MSLCFEVFLILRHAKVRLGLKVRPLSASLARSLQKQRCNFFAALICAGAGRKFEDFRGVEWVSDLHHRGRGWRRYNLMNWRFRRLRSGHCRSPLIRNRSYSPPREHHEGGVDGDGSRPSDNGFPPLLSRWRNVAPDPPLRFRRHEGREGNGALRLCRLCSLSKALHVVVAQLKFDSIVARRGRWGQLIHLWGPSEGDNERSDARRM
jgi:hypothetical protein